MKGKYAPVLYYDASDMERVMDIIEPLAEYFKRESVPFIFLPKDITELKYQTKDELLKWLDDVKKEVEKWD